MSTADERGARRHADDGPSLENNLVIALSGGGHRATLYALGFLIAVIDRGLNGRVAQVSSVSGGSILNAAIVKKGLDLSKVSSETFLEMAGKDVVRAISKRGGVFGWIWILGLLCIYLLMGGVTGILLRGTPAPIAVIVLVTLMASCVPIMFAGKALELRLARTHLRKSPKSADRMHLGSKGGDLKFESSVEHVFCVTDLAGGLPAYFSTWDDGWFIRRVAQDVWGQMSLLPGQTRKRYSHAGHRTLAEVVRASAGFPGFPPKRLRIEFGETFRAAAGQDRPTSTPQTAVYLSDGGIANNLGTQYLREDRQIRAQDGPEHLYTVLGANASARGYPSLTWIMRVPLFSLVAQMVSFLFIMNANTIEPRVAGSLRYLGAREDRAIGAELITNVTSMIPDTRSSSDGPVVNNGMSSQEVLEKLDQEGWWTTLKNAALFEPPYDTPPTTLGALKTEVIRRTVLKGYVHAYFATLGFSSSDATQKENVSIAGKTALDRINRFIEMAMTDDNSRQQGKM